MSRPRTPPINESLAITSWHPILEASNQVVLYNPTSKALSITSSASSVLPLHHHASPQSNICALCNRPLPEEEEEDKPARHAPNYFQLLSDANNTLSRPSTPPSRAEDPPNSNTADGYFARFFKEEYRLGMGANGSVYLCQHVLDGNPLGHFAVKKIAVGQSHDYLLKILREVRLLETLRHENIVSYHHAWLETARFSSFGPPVPTLHILMQWAEGGSLDDLIDARKGVGSPILGRAGGATLAADSGQQSRSSRIRAFRAQRGATTDERKTQRQRQTKMAVHLLSGEEIKSLFQDVTAGLAFLHDRSILHLDLKPGNVLLTYDEGRLIPRGMLSDFGTSQDSISPPRVRSGNTGTLEYTAPEQLAHDAAGNFFAVDSKADIWSLGMILHKLVFFRLPWKDTERDVQVAMDELEHEILDYGGFQATPDVITACKRRSLPRAIPILLESLLSLSPASRPSSERVLSVIREGKFDPIIQSPPSRKDSSSLIRRSSPPRPPIVIQEARGATITEEDIRNAPIIEEEADAEQELDATTPIASPRSSRSLEQIPLVELGGRSFGEKTPLLGLPPPPLPPLWRSMLLPRNLIMGVKSGLLIVKVSSMLRLCSSSTLLPGHSMDVPAAPPALLVSAILVPAVADLWSDSVKLSVMLGVSHLIVIWLIGNGSWCRGEDILY